MPTELSQWLSATKALVGSPSFLWLSMAAFGVSLVLRQRANIVFGLRYAKATAVSLWERVPAPKAPSLSPTMLLAGVMLLSLAANRGCALPDINWIPSVIVKTAPIDAPGLHVLIVEETNGGKDLPPTQLAVLQTTLIKEFVQSKTPDGFRQYDPTNTVADPKWAAALARPRTSLPWIIVSNPGKGGFEGPLPQTIDETLALIRGYE